MLDFVEENSCEAAKIALIDPQKLAKEIDEFLAKQSASYTALTTGTTASGGDFASWPPPPEYKPSETPIASDPDAEVELTSDSFVAGEQFIYVRPATLKLSPKLSILRSHSPKQTLNLVLQSQRATPRQDLRQR